MSIDRFQECLGRQDDQSQVVVGGKEEESNKKGNRPYLSVADPQHKSWEINISMTSSCSRTTMPITAISPTVVPPNIVKKDVHIPGGPGVTPNHVLYLDLSSWHSRPMVVPDADHDPQFLLSIRDAIHKSRQPGGIPFDAVTITYCTGNTPDPALWEALAGARPSHLEMTAGWDETCNYDGLSKVQPPWDLKSMYLAAYEGDGCWDWNLKDATRQQPSFRAGRQSQVRCYTG